jgi:imidazolonepropionase
LLTLRGPRTPRRGPELNDLGVIHDGSLLIRDGILEEVGPTRRVENLIQARGAIEINAAGRVVMPGFVDSHTHLAFPGPDASDLAYENAIHSLQTTSSKLLGSRTLTYLEAMVRHGTTTVEVKTGCGPDEPSETKVLRSLTALKQELLDVVPTFLFRLPPACLKGEVGMDEAVEWVCSSLLPKLWNRDLARYADLAWDANQAHYPAFSRYLQAARSLGFGCKVHADQVCSATAIRLAVEQFAVSVDHLEHATPLEVGALAGSCTIATLLPCASFQTGRGNAPARALIDAGVPVALASNFNPLYAPTLNMQTVASLACLRMGMSVAEAISAATINGAHALGRADRLGSLERGKSADLLILNISDYQELAHHFGMNLVRMTMKRGAFIYKEGEVAVREAKEFCPAW